ncbi:hypothetical protein BG262_07070 [Floricoccus penangensis]|uniref:DUF3278 domain-containing protein n=1 Tax=Floricoccus penangensis TaxID=1859475 RepID=A0A9Q5JF66_9LACT|nr:DUF3278 domain-containing protein [Floricoccus penangensis]OFI45753.1 hypothetical protein BG262_07070 [Floricoccus penangensis]
MKKDNSETLWVKLVRKFYGIEGPIDEYIEKSINRIGNFGFIISEIYIFISVPLLLIAWYYLDYENFPVAIIIYSLVYIIIIGTFIPYLMNKYKVGFAFQEKDYKSVMRSSRKNIFFSSIVFTSFLLLTDIFFTAIGFDEGGWSKVFSLKNIIPTIFFGIIWGILMYLLRRSSVKKSIRETELMEED